ncbi:MAG: copper resistance protein NlpE N-terminal domain-containing protein [Flavobacteriaceae bacterium]|nr:copper resistance protein NlpE N-terminal domain-containing protein [Flavobacteriaceae bacterium]
MKPSILLLAMTAVLLTSCNFGDKTQQDKTDKTIPMADNSQTSLDWPGVYVGTLPCADCEGIRTQIRLSNHSTYEIETKYLGKSDKVFRSNGLFTWDDTKNKIRMEQKDAKAMMHYQVGENHLIVLNQEGKKIESDLPSEMYFLQKIIPDTIITDKHWRLIHLNGKSIHFDENSKEPFITLNHEDNQLYGNGGCNSIGGSYELSGDTLVSFSKMRSTLMACQDVEYEGEFLEALQNTDNYIVKQDTLTLKNAETTLAKLIAVYL